LVLVFGSAATISAIEVSSGTVIKFRGARAEFRDNDRGWHRGWDRDRGGRTVIIKCRHRDWD
jgi:hypothetical protein